LKVIHVIGDIQELASGPSHSVPALCQSLFQLGESVELHASLGHPPAAHGYPSFEHIRTRYLKNLWISPSFRRDLEDRAKLADIIHSHGLWIMPFIYAGWACDGRRCQLVISPRGTLRPVALAQSRFKKKLMWWLWQRKVVAQAACLHATSEAEAQEMRRLGLVQPIAVIPNGVDLPEQDPLLPDRHEPRILLYLGRIAPIKGLENLLQAWSVVSGEFPNWNLQISGTDSHGHRRKIQRLAEQLGLPRVRFTGPLYAESKLEAFRRAELFVLPSKSENFGMAVAEALAHGLPVIVTKNAPWSGIATRDCGWWIDGGVAPLEQALREALAETPDRLLERGIAGRRWIEAEFGWNQVGLKMKQTYEWLLGRRSIPEWVITA
jgi:glycosyltransferase involved in cell wall biosynthesis